MPAQRHPLRPTRHRRNRHHPSRGPSDRGPALRVEGWRYRPLDAAPYTYVWVDAPTQKVREGGRIVNVAVVHAVGVNVEGPRETLGMDVITTEDSAGWTAFLRDLVACGLAGVQQVTSDAHAGLTDAVGAVLPGASWQRCRTHFMRNLLSRVPKSAPYTPLKAGTANSAESPSPKCGKRVDSHVWRRETAGVSASVGGGDGIVYCGLAGNS